AFSGVRELFQKIRTDGRRIALASSSPEEDLRAYLEITRVGDLVEQETTAGDVSRTKPHPDVFESALAKLGDRDPAEVVAVGDPPDDAEAARKIGLPTIGVLCGGSSEEELRKAGCFAVFHGPADLLARYEESPLAAEALPSGETTPRPSHD